MPPRSDSWLLTPTSTMKRAKRAISFVIFNDDRSKLLAVKRPADDEDLPNAWGLPAGSLQNDESYEEAVIRSGREKLGVEVSVGPLLNEGDIERDDYVLHMRLYKATIADGHPSVPQPVEHVTQYIDWAWAIPERLRAAADRGSLCSRLALDALDS